MTRFVARASCSLLVVLLCLTNVGVERARASAAGTVISDTATMGYQDASSNAYAAVSNTVTTTVANLPSLSISTPAGQNVTAIAIAIDTFTLTNTGNAAGNFQVLNTPSFGGTATGTISAGFVLNGATSSTCSTASLCSLSVLATQLAALAPTAITGTITIGVAYQAVGATSGQTVQTPLTATISYPANGGVTAATGSTTATATDTIVADARLDIQASASQPAVIATPIAWTIKANNGGPSAAYDSQAAKNLLGAAAAGVAVVVQVPAFGGTALTLPSTPTCTLAGGAGGSAALYYSTTASNPTGANWSAGWAANAIWVACYVSGGAGGSELPSDPGSSAGSMGTATAQITLTILTAQPAGRGASATGSVSVIANGYMDGVTWATAGQSSLLGPGVPVGTADASSVPLNTSVTESNATPSSGTMYGGASNVGTSQAFVVQARLDVMTSVVQPSSAAAIAWTVKANNGGTGAAYGSNLCYAGIEQNLEPYGACLIVQIPTFGGALTPLTAVPTLTIGPASTGSQLLYSTSASAPTNASAWTSTYTASATWIAAYVWSTSDAVGAGTHSILPSDPGSSAGTMGTATAQITLTFSTAQPTGSGSYASNVVSVIANGIIDDTSGTVISAPTITVGTADPITPSAIAADIVAVENNLTPSVSTTPPGGASQIASSQAWVGTEPRMDVKETASAPGATITWTVTANDGGAGAAYSTLAVQTVFGTTDTALAVIAQIPASNGTTLTLQNTATCSATGSGYSCVVYYGQTNFPGNYTGNATCTTLWCTTYSAADTWIAAVVYHNSTSHQLLYASTPGGSGGAGVVGTPQITLTFATAQPSGATGTGLTNTMATALVADASSNLIGPNVNSATADSANSFSVITVGEFNQPAAVGSLNQPGGASNQANIAATTDNITTGPYGLATATGSSPALINGANGGVAAATNNLDFTAITAPCTNAGGSANNGATCTVGANVTFINTVANAADALTTVTLTADAPPGWTVQLYGPSLTCSGGTATWPSCVTQGASIAGPSTNGGIVSGTITVASAGSANYEAVYNAVNNSATPFAAADTLITASGYYGGVDANTTHNDIYPGGVLKLTQSVAVGSSNCPVGSPGVCPGGVLDYSLVYLNIAPSGSTVTNKGTEPAFAYNALISSASGALVTVDGSTTWALNTFGLNAAPVDTNGSTAFTYTPAAGGFATGTYPSITAGHTGFVATIGGGGHQVLAGETGTITYNTTVK